MRMKNIFQLTTIATLLGASSLSHAELTTNSGSENFSGSASVSASSTSQLSASNANNNASVAIVSLGQFDSSLGVLTGVELQLDSTRTQTLDGAGYKNNGPQRTAGGNGTSTAAISVSGVSTVFSPAISQTGSGCGLAGGMTGYISCNWAPETSSETTNANTTVASTQLNDYVGNGTVDASLILPTLEASATLTETRGQQSGSTVNYSVAWDGSLQAIYSYLLHAAPSFDAGSMATSLTLDFGTIQQYSVASLNFDLFNMADSNRTGLDLDSFSGTGDTEFFSTNLSQFSNLEQGGSQGFFATLLTDTLGSFNAQYLLNLSDADFDASDTWHNHHLTLNLTGNVSAVPVPAAVWLFSSALIGLIGSRRLKKTA